MSIKLPAHMQVSRCDEMVSVHVCVRAVCVRVCVCGVCNFFNLANSTTSITPVTCSVALPIVQLHSDHTHYLI